MKKDSRASEAESLKQQQQLLLFLDLRATAKKKGGNLLHACGEEWEVGREGSGEGR